jgi:hypothetical protein
MKPKRRKGVLGVLNRIAAYEKARQGMGSPSSLKASVEIDRKLLWLWRKVSST